MTTLNGTCILESNEIAIEMLVGGSYRDAIVACQNGLRILRSRFSPLEKTDEENTCLEPTCAFLHYELVSTGLSESEIQHTPFRTYDKAIRILRQYHEGETSSPEQEMLKAVVLLYNMALAFHCSSIHNATDRKSLLCNALHIYDMALQVLNNAPQDEMDVLFFSMAIVNNMGSIYFDFLDSANVEKCLDGLKYSLSRFGQYRNSDLLEETMHFLMNVIAVDGQHYRCAPAA